jgi:hypothetical protein
MLSLWARQPITLLTKPEVANMQIEDVQERYEQQLINIPGVTAIGIGEQNGQPVIVIMVSQRTEELTQKLPQQLDGYDVRVEVSGDLVAF